MSLGRWASITHPALPNRLLAICNIPVHVDVSYLPVSSSIMLQKKMNRYHNNVLMSIFINHFTSKMATNTPSSYEIGE